MKRFRLIHGEHWTTYTVSHAQVTEVRPGSPIAERDGNRPGWQFELCGVVEIDREDRTDEGRRIVTESTPPHTVFVHVPTDGETVYEMDDTGQNLRKYAWPTNTTEEIAP